MIGANVFSAKIWFVKTSTRIVKYESRVVKSNPAVVKIYPFATLFWVNNENMQPKTFFGS